MIHALRITLAAALIFSAACSSKREEKRSALVMNEAALRAAEYDLIDVRTFIPSISVDLRYGTAQNPTKRPIYPADMPCLLKTDTAVKLRKAQAILKTRGLGLRIWDAWRPPEVQVLLVEADGNTGLFMDPKSAWSRHCSGTAVDVTVVDLKGREQPMPTYHDEGGPAAHYLYKGHNPKIKRNIHCLQRAMFDAGFIILDTEWWHFDDSDFYTAPTPVVFGHQIGIRPAQNP